MPNKKTQGPMPKLAESAETKHTFKPKIKYSIQVNIKFGYVVGV